MPQPTTQWTRDNGTTIELNEGYLVDELGGHLIDESGLFLLDTVSSDGTVAPQSWDATADLPQMWSDSFEARTSTATRTTAQGDTRVTAQGDTRVASVSVANIQNPTTWVEEYA